MYLMSKIKIWVFDFDGTLVDSNLIKRNCFFEVVKDDPNGAKLMCSVLLKNNGDRATIFDKYCAIREDFCGRSNDLLSQYSNLVNRRVAEAQEVPGAVDFLEKLRKSNVKIVLSSATPINDLITVLDMKSWRKKFDLIYGSPSKKSLVIKEQLLRFECLPSEIAVVGDGEDDLNSAWSNGCEFFPIGDARGYRENGGTDEIHTFLSLCQRVIGTED